MSSGSSSFPHTTVTIDPMAGYWPDFTRRASTTEYIDHPRGLSSEELARTFDELRLVNRWLGGRRAVLGPLTAFLESSGVRPHGKPLTVLDVGCGSGDIIASLKEWSAQKQIWLRVAGLDLSHYALSRGQSAKTSPIWLLQGDVQFLPFSDRSVDFVICSAFLHHFDDETAVEVLQKLARIVRVGIIVSDLRRHPVAYLGIRLLTALFSSSRAVRHDGPLSVLKAFTPEELDRLIQRAGLLLFHTSRSWAFRYSVLAIKQTTNR